MSYWVIAAVLIFTFIFIAKKTRNPKNRPPGPWGLPIIGNLHQLGSKPHRSLFKLSEKYGPIMYLKLGNVRTVVVSSPETVKQVLKTFDSECCSRPHSVYPAKLTYNGCDLVFAPYNDYWRDLRKMSMLELYSAKRVSSFRGVREDEVASLMEFVKESALSGTPVNLSRKLMSLSASVICRIGFGMNLRGSKLEEKYEDVIQQAMSLLGSFPVEDFFPYFGWIVDRLTGLYSKGEKTFQELDEFYEQAIKQHLEPKTIDRGEDFIDLLLHMEKQQLGLGNFQLTRNHIKGILVNVLLAGVDTSAATIAWAMTHLMKNPRVMKKAQAEVREIIKNKDNITEEDIDKLDYLKMVIKETFRINPLTPLLVTRKAMADITINGYKIPKNTRIDVNIWAIHRNADIWEDPENFIPERFMDDQVDYKGQNFKLLPFGSGRRMCPGLGMGMSLVHLTLIHLLYRFNWKLPEGMKTEDIDLEEVYALVSVKKIPLHLVPIATQWT